MSHRADLHNLPSTRFGERLRRARQACGLTQAELAERARVSVRGINDLERGVRQRPRKETVALLAQALGLSDDDRASFEAAARGSAERQTVAQGESSALPSGTVTFLCTDLEGSTRLLQQLVVARYTEALETMRRLLRASCVQHKGHEVDATGDSSFFAFAQAPEAVVAAAQAQHAIAAHTWPDEALVRVRMGLHTGTAQVVGERYIGLDAHRAARIAAAGHGGHALLSWATCALVEDALPEGALLRDLGAHRLKDLQRPERLFQLVLPDLPADLPPLNALDRHPHNLPIQPTPLLGREREVAEVCALLRHDDVRLVTLTGPGGVGKTRLALQVAADLLTDLLSDGVWFVPLSRLADPDLVLPTIAQTLGLRESGGQPIQEVLREYVQTRTLLLLLDNFEQVVAAAPEVAALVASSPGVNVLVTSRVGLHLRGEKEYHLSPLALPPVAEPTPRRRVSHYSPQQLTDFTEYAAVALFLQRAQDAQPAFHLTPETALAVAAICARLDGLPLALELAAARVKVLPPAALLQRLERRLPLLTGGARDFPERQQTMRGTLAWSEDLLQPEERRLFRRLAIFVGGFTLEAAEAVCALPAGAAPLGMDVLDGLERLVAQSLVQPWTVDGAGQDRAEEGGEARFRLLHVVREFAQERLKANGDGAEAEALLRAHATYYLDLTEQAEPELARTEQGVWLTRLEREHDNFRAALAWARDRGETATGLRLATRLARFWRARGYLSEGRTWLEGLLGVAGLAQLSAVEEARLPPGVTMAGWARAVNAAGWLALWQRDDGRAAQWLEMAAVTARAAGDPQTLADALRGLGLLALQRRDLGQAAARLEESLRLAREADSSSDVVQAVLRDRGWVAYYQGDVARATACFEEGFALIQQLGDHWGEAIWQVTLGELALRAGDLTQAVILERAALQQFLTLGTSVDIAMALELVALAALAAGGVGKKGRAARLLGAAASVRVLVGATRRGGP